MKTLYLSIEYDSEVIEDNYGYDGPYTGYCHEAYTNHRFTLSEEKPEYPNQTIETDLEDPHVVVVIYGDGGTFGRTDGYTEYIGCFDKDTAEKLCELIESHAKYNPFSMFDFDRKQKQIKKDDILDKIVKIVNKKYFYCCWDGDFASFEEVVIVTKSNLQKKWYR